jgi:hypothetical protein
MQLNEFIGTTALFYSLANPIGVVPIFVSREIAGGRTRNFEPKRARHVRQSSACPNRSELGALTWNSAAGRTVKRRRTRRPSFKFSLTAQSVYAAVSSFISRLSRQEADPTRRFQTRATTHGSEA